MLEPCTMRPTAGRPPLRVARARPPAAPRLCTWPALRLAAEIIFKISILGNEKCKQALDAYSECIKGRTVSVLWACKDLYQASQACMDK